jgi:hypothetical protein
MNYLEKDLKESFRPIKRRDEFGQRVQSPAPITNHRDLAQKLGMTKSTLYRWISNPAQRNFTDEQLKIIHEQLNWKQFGLDNECLVPIQQTHEILERDKQEAHLESRLLRFSKVDESLAAQLTEELKAEVEKIVEDEKSRAVRRAIRVEAERYNEVSEAFREQSMKMQKANEELKAMAKRLRDAEKNLRFAQETANKQTEMLETALNKLAS